MKSLAFIVLAFCATSCLSVKPESGKYWHRIYCNKISQQHEHNTDHGYAENYSLRPQGGLLRTMLKYY